MEDQIKKLFSHRGRFKPAGDFQERSRRLILMAQQNKYNLGGVIRQSLFDFKLTLALTMAGLLIIFIGSYSFFGSNLLTSRTANGADVKIEYENLNFQIQLKEAKYYTESAKEIAAVLKEIQKPNAGLLN